MKAPRGTDEAKLVTLIQTKSVRGQGTDEDPMRYVFQYWDFEGNMVAEKDTFKKAAIEEEQPIIHVGIDMDVSQTTDMERDQGIVLEALKKMKRRC